MGRCQTTGEAHYCICCQYALIYPLTAGLPQWLGGLGARQKTTKSLQTLAFVIECCHGLLPNNWRNTLLNLVPVRTNLSSQSRAASMAGRSASQTENSRIQTVRSQTTRETHYCICSQYVLIYYLTAGLPQWLSSPATKQRQQRACRHWIM